MTRRNHCLSCGKPLAEHRRFTAEDVAASKGATFNAPVNGYLSPLSPSVVGQWIGHDPMPWRGEQASESEILAALDFGRTAEQHLR